jgi:hypothetical protein
MKKLMLALVGAPGGLCRARAPSCDGDVSLNAIGLLSAKRLPVSCF